MLVLTPQLRVTSDEGVLKLQPEQVVAKESEIDGFEEPPLDALVPLPDVTMDDSYPTIEVDRTTEAEFNDLSAKIAALETAIAKTADQWEPDDAGHDAYAGTEAPAMEWREGVELDGTGRPLMPEPVATVHADDTQVSTAFAEDQVDAALDEQIIDEETLRVMVAEIVRAELHGELGERITRNVRKLVRQEVARALVALRG